MNRIANPKLEQWLEKHGSGAIKSVYGKAGGSINEAWAIITTSGDKFFVKQHRSAPLSMFESEARSLQIIASSNTLPVPQPYFWDDEYLLMEFIEPGPKQANYWQEFGFRLASMHQNTQEFFGLNFKTYCGTTEQNNTRQKDGYQFFAGQRLLSQGFNAHANGHLTTADINALEHLCKLLPALIPEQPASLIHGDLWSGNAHSTATGNPMLIDPALYYGWREADLAMTRLFGGFPKIFYDAYNEAWPLEHDWQQRFDIYNLYHLLNHLNLFGKGYLTQTRQVLKQYQ